jgi:hypothetical protein
MRKLIRSKSTGAFLTADRGWTNDLVSARGFLQASSAIEEARRLNLEDAEIYYSFSPVEVTPADFAIPLGFEPGKSSFWGQEEISHQ